MRDLLRQEGRITGDKMKLLYAPLLAAVIACASTTARAESDTKQRPAEASFIQEFDNALAPMNFVKFCMNNVAECRADASARSLPPADAAMAMLRQVNMSVNQAIAPMRKPTDPIAANWTVAPAAGDCNDYAVTKRHQLIAMGWPQAALRLAVVRIDGGQGHLVLVARLSDGDVVLDNLSSSVRPWNALGYEWISMQSSTDPRFWVNIGDHGRQLREKRFAQVAGSSL
ncbi:transglutaminase-like cysteine peptidase [Bradyrhizobium guangdongense]|nr:transglutaminase-like cysteine peptidase [Bradyrhizobium guangdongense]